MSGVAARHRGDYGGYFILDQLLWRTDGASDSGLGGFLRLGGNPSDRNLIELHMDGGLTYAARPPDHTSAPITPAATPPTVEGSYS